MNILLIPNMDKDLTKKYLNEIITILRNDKVIVFLDSEFKNTLDLNDVVFGKEEMLMQNSDLVITIGGDGTLIQAAKRAAIYNIPLLGINSGRLGFLTTLEISEIGCLKNLANQEKITEERMLINIKIIRENKIVFMENALNEAVIKNSDTSAMVELDIYCDGRFVNEYRADGLIYSTPTGSTAYNLSAGGPIISPNVPSLAITPICPHSLFSRTIIFPSNSTIETKIGKTQISDLEQNLEINIDGYNDFHIKSFDEVIITESILKAKTIYLKNRKFFDVLNLKMMGRS